MFRILGSLTIVAVTCGLCFSQAPSEVKVRVLDYRTGHPAARWKVGLLVRDNWVVAKTAKDGVAMFRISEPLPQTVTIDPEAGSWSEWACSDKGIFQTSEVLQHGFGTGFLQHPLCRHHTASDVIPRNGEIVIHVRHLNPWLTLRRVLWECFYG
jgi:hypothetical protein